MSYFASTVLRWLQLIAWLFMALVLGAVLALLGCWDFLRWLLSPIWPIERRHPERPGDWHPFS